MQNNRYVAVTLLVQKNNIYHNNCLLCGDHYRKTQIHKCSNIENIAQFVKLFPCFICWINEHKTCEIHMFYYSVMWIQNSAAACSLQQNSVCSLQGAFDSHISFIPVVVHFLLLDYIIIGAATTHLYCDYTGTKSETQRRPLQYFFHCQLQLEVINYL